MKKAITILFFFTTTIFSLSAQIGEKSLLWKVSGNGLEKASYLFGTIHLLCPDQLTVSEKVSKALEDSDRLILELDFDDPTLMIAIQKGMILEEGKTVMDFMTEEEVSTVENFFSEEMHMSLQQLAMIKPFFLMSLTSMYYMDCTPASWELKLTELAGAANKEVLGLETAEDQLSFIDNIPLEDQIDMLLMNIVEREESGEMSAKMVEDYLNEDIDALHDAINEYMSEEYSEMNDDLLVNRNNNWIPVIKDMMKEAPSLFAFGAGHLPGKNGVIMLLKDAGYTVEPVY